MADLAPWLIVLLLTVVVIVLAHQRNESWARERAMEIDLRILRREVDALRGSERAAWSAVDQATADLSAATGGFDDA